MRVRAALFEAPGAPLVEAIQAALAGEPGRVIVNR
jgi:hypothetical protein